ncbi:hypothetical protein EZI54_06905 [Marinobacter halodurans]|uniref:Uncharacterized protein n=1 Tax=Marinobacter halodurans TaxID=2528979 RepID=A0ABY1ZR69_9GAMM|nr:hypothetical protein [Marinobacter halodurans]TBW57380.1 hypothetical protein EZI54_06905 [Marinobacter halodurans]
MALMLQGLSEMQAAVEAGASARSIFIGSLPILLTGFISLMAIGKGVAFSPNDRAGETQDDLIRQIKH